MSFSVIFEIVYIQSLPKVPPPPAYLKNASEVWKTAKNEFNQFEENFFQLRIFLTRKAREDARGRNIKISNGRVDLAEHILGKIPSRQEFC